MGMVVVAFFASNVGPSPVVTIVNFMGPLQAPDPRAQPFRAVPSIDPELSQAGHAIRKIAVQQGHEALSIIDVGCRHHHGDNQPQRVHQQMALAPFDFFYAYRTLRPGFG